MEHKRYYVRQYAFLDGYLNQVVDSNTGNVVNTFVSYNNAHKHCEELNNA